MGHREFTRRTALRTLGLGAIGTVAARSGGTASAQETPDNNRPDERIQFVEADPEAGFNFPYWLATPETFRSEPVPLLVEWVDSADPGQPLTGGGPDKPVTVSEQARNQVVSSDRVSVLVSEGLGVPQLVPVIPEPSRTEKTTQIDRETLLIEEGDLERIDRQLLRMTEHARETVLDAHEMHDQLLFWGNSSAGSAAQHMAVLHPDEILAFACSGSSGVLTLPLAQLGPHTLKYQIGIADLEALTGTPFDADAFDEVDKFYLLGEHDVSNRLKFKVPGQLPGVFSPEQYEIAKAVYGRDMHAERFPRCQIAFEKAGISAQFRLYPEMTHDPELAGPDVLEFLRRSIQGDSVSTFGQRLRLPFQRTVALKTPAPKVGEPLRFAVSGEYPPPEGLVTYDWQVDDGRTASGPEATFTFADGGSYEVRLSMETAHGQVAHRGMSLMAEGSSLAAYRYDVTPPRTELEVRQSILIETEITNVGAAPGDRRFELYVDGEKVDSRGAALEPGASKRIPFSHPFDEPGTYEVSIPPAFRQTISVAQEPTSTPETSQTEANQTPASEHSPDDSQDATRTSAEGPGFGVVTALTGIGGGLVYRSFTRDSDDGND